MRSNRLETLPATRRPLVQVPVREANQLRFQVLIINITEPVDCPNRKALLEGKMMKPKSTRRPRQLVSNPRIMADSGDTER